MVSARTGSPRARSTRATLVDLPEANSRTLWARLTASSVNDANVMVRCTVGVGPRQRIMEVDYGVKFVELSLRAPHRRYWGERAYGRSAVTCRFRPPPVAGGVRPACAAAQGLALFDLPAPAARSVA